MIQKHSSLEMVLGLVLFALATGFGFHLWRDKGLLVGQEYYQIKASLDNAGGLDVGSAVKIGGVKVGRITVKELNVTTYRSDVVLEIANHVLLPKDSRLVVGSAGLLGAPEIKIELGGEGQNMRDGDSFQFVQSQPSLEEMIGRAIFVLNAVGAQENAGGDENTETGEIESTP